MAILCGSSFAESTRIKTSTTKRWLQQAQQCYERMDYECSIDMALAAIGQAEHLKQSHPIDEKDRVHLYRILAFSYGAENRPEEAVHAFLSILKIDEGFELDPQVISPKIYAFYRKAKESYFGERLDMEPAIITRQYQGSPMTPLEKVLIDLRPLTMIPSELLVFESAKEKTAWEIDLRGGVVFVFDEDADNFRHGPAVSLSFSYSFARHWGVELTALGSFHDIKAPNLQEGVPDILLVMQVSAGVFFRWTINKNVEIRFQPAIGVSLFGVGNFTDKTGLSTLVHADLSYHILSFLSMGLRLSPHFVIVTNPHVESSFLFALLGHVAFTF